MCCWSGQGLWLLLHHQYWTLTEMPLRYPAVGLNHRNPLGMVLQDWSLHVLQQVIDGVVVGMGQIKTLHVGLGGSCIAYPGPPSEPIPLRREAGPLGPALPPTPPSIWP